MTLARVTPVTVTTGMSAFFIACTAVMAPSRTPFARAERDPDEEGEEDRGQAELDRHGKRRADDVGYRALGAPVRGPEVAVQDVDQVVGVLLRKGVVEVVLAVEVLSHPLQ